MDRLDGIELTLLLLSSFMYVGYHLWLYNRKDKLSGGSPPRWFSVYGTTSVAKLMWAHGCASEEKDAITAVQTLRNALMVVALMSQAAAYIGARALPDVLLNSDYSEKLLTLGEIDPITGGPGRRGLVSSVGKASVGLILIWACVLCLGQAARFYVHLGFMVKVVSSKYNAEHWSLEEETLAVTHQAGLYFSLAWRIFYAFGLTVLYLPGVTSLFVSTLVLTTMLYFSDHLPRYKYSKAMLQVKKGRLLETQAELAELPV